MPTQKLKNKNIRKLTRMGSGGGSLGLTIPKELVTKLSWKERQKVVVRKSGKKLTIEDWSE